MCNKNNKLALFHLLRYKTSPEKINLKHILVEEMKLSEQVFYDCGIRIARI